MLAQTQRAPSPEGRGALSLTRAAGLERAQDYFTPLRQMPEKMTTFSGEEG